MVHNTVNRNKMGVTVFKQKVVEKLLFPNTELDEDEAIDQPQSENEAMNDPEPGPSRPRPSVERRNTLLARKLIKIEGKNNRRKCKRCYKLMVREKGTKYSQIHSKKVSTKCNTCNDFLCLHCFNEIHK